MTLTFPCRPSMNKLGGVREAGKPTRAHHCRCAEGPMVVGDTCLRCGRYEKATIAGTWSERARASAANAAKRKMAA